MATKRIHERQQLYHYYKQKTGKTEVDMHELARFAHDKMGWPLPVPPDPLDLMAKQFSEAAREEVRRDKQTKQPYRANLSFTKPRGDGKQMTLWVDVDEALRDQMVRGLTNYRDQMVGEAVIATNTADHWNRANKTQQPLVFITDFTDDVQWRLNAPDDNEKAS